MPAKRVTAFLCLGANIGDRKKNLDRALDLLAEHITIAKVSSVYETEAVTDPPQPPFLNLVCRINTVLAPEKLLETAKAVENRIGPHRHNEPRLIDIDILLYDDLIINRPDLILPHPRMAERAFVLMPLAEIAPEVVHPVTRRTVRDILAELKDRHAVYRWLPARGES